MIKEFREFIMRGNVLDLAVGIIIGASFTAIVGSLVKDVIMPIVSLLTRGVDFSNLFIPLQAIDPEKIKTLADAQTAGIATINVGLFINAVINFLIVAFVVFMIVRTANNLKKKEEVSAPPAPPAPDPQIELQQQLIATLERLNATLDKR